MAEPISKAWRRSSLPSVHPIHFAAKRRPRTRLPALQVFAAMKRNCCGSHTLPGRRYCADFQATSTNRAGSESRLINQIQKFQMNVKKTAVFVGLGLLVGLAVVCAATEASHWFAAMFEPSSLFGGAFSLAAVPIAF